MVELELFEPKEITSSPRDSGQVELRIGRRGAIEQSGLDPSDWGAEPDAVHWNTDHFEPEEGMSEG